MARIEWRGVEAPDLGTALQAYRAGADTFDKAFTTARGGLKDWEDRQTKEASNQLMAKLMTQYQGDPEGLQRDAQSGALLAGYDPRGLSAEALASIGARTQDLQNFQLGTRNIEGVGLRNERTRVDTDQQVRENDEWIKTTAFTNVDRDKIRAFRPLAARIRALSMAGTPQADAEAQQLIKQYMPQLSELPDEAQVAIIGTPLSARRGRADLGSVEASTATERERPGLVRAQRGEITVDTNTKSFELDSAKADRAANDRALGAMRGLPVGATRGQIDQAFRNAINGLDGRSQEIVRNSFAQRFGSDFFSPMKDASGNDIYPDAPTTAQPTEAAPITLAPQPGTPAARLAPQGASFTPGTNGAAALLQTAAAGGAPAAAAPVDFNSLSFEEIGRINAAGGNSLERPANPAAELLARTAAGGPSRVLNYEAREKTGLTHVPENIDTLGKASSFAKQLNRAGAKSSAMGTFQIVGGTMRRYAPKVFGKDWKNVPLNDVSQDRIAERIFNDHRGSAVALSKQWVSLSIAEAERVRRMPWAQARQVIASKESGNGRVSVPGGPGIALASLDRNGLGADFGGTTLNRDRPVPGASAEPEVSPLSGRVFGGSRSLENMPTALEQRSPEQELLAAAAARSQTPQPITLSSIGGQGRRPTTNVAALLENLAAAARGRFS